MIVTGIGVRWEHIQYILDRDFPGGPVVKNLPSNAGDLGSIPGLGTKIPTCHRAIKPARLNKRAHVPQTTERMRPGASTSQLERSSCTATREKPAHHNKELSLQRKIPCASMKTPHAATKTRRSQK